MSLPVLLPVLGATCDFLAQDSGARDIRPGGQASEADVFSPTLKKGSVELLVLALLRDGARHGYEIGKLIEVRSGGRLQFRVSSLYPVLCRLEERACIEGRWVEKPAERRRRYYRLTRKGRKALAEEKATWDEFALAVKLVVESSHA